MNKRRVLEELKKSPKKVRFGKLCTIAEAFGFRLRGGKGSHRIYVRDGVEELLNFQNVGGKAKPYQVRQLIKNLSFKKKSLPKKYYTLYITTNIVY